MSDTQHSPHRTSRPEMSVPWTIDNAESRISSVIQNSPKSILKGSRTPNPYISPQFNCIQNERYETMINCRVSFASDTWVRLFGKNETPNSPSQRTLSQRLSTTSPGANDDSPTSESIVLDNDDSHATATKSDNAYLLRLSGSPMDRRKRRRDMYGSPPSQREEKRMPVIYPEHRVRGMQKLGDDDDDDLDDDNSSHNNYYMQFLSQDNHQQRKPLFDEDVDDDDTQNKRMKVSGNNDNTNDDGRTKQTTLTTSYVSSLTPPTARALSPNSLYADNDVDAHEDMDRQHAATRTNHQSSFAEADETTEITEPTQYLDTKQTRMSVTFYNEDTGTMPLTLQHNGEISRQQGTPVDDTMDLWNATATADLHQNGQQEQQHNQHEQDSQESPQQPNNDNPIPSSFIHSQHLDTQFNSQKKSQDSDMKLTQESSTLKVTNSPNGTKSSNNASYYAFNTSSPIRTPIQSPFRSPLKSTDRIDNTFDFPKSPRVGISILDNMDASPILPRRSPVTDQSHSAAPPTLSDSFSPKRSFYLHDPTQSHTPLATTTSNNYPAPHSTKSPLRQQSFRRDLSDLSIGSDYGDRMVSMHGNENVNIFEEEFPQLYNSFTEDTPTTKPMTLAYFLDTAAGFKQLVEDKPIPKQTNTSSMKPSNVPATFDQQATAATSLLPELDAYRKLTEKYDQVIQKLTDQLQQLDDDLSENIPQVFAEYADASPEVCDEMESSFSDLRKLVTAETEQKWYTEYMSIVQDLVALFRRQLKDQVEDQQLLRQAKNRLAQHLPQLMAEKHKVAGTLNESQETVQKYKQMDHRLLERWERDIEDQEVAIERSRKEAQKVKEKYAQTRKELNLLDEKKATLQAAITKAEATKDAHPYVSYSDFLDAKDQFDICSVLCAWKLQDKNENTIQFTVYNDIDILIDTSKLKNRQVDAVFIRMLESKDREYGPFAELVHGLQVMARGTWRQEKVLKKRVRNKENLHRCYSIDYTRYCYLLESCTIDPKRNHGSQTTILDRIGTSR
ncbi:unnamed protein product [Absidia cylindrospora]